MNRLPNTRIQPTALRFAPCAAEPQVVGRQELYCYVKNVVAEYNKGAVAVRYVPKGAWLRRMR